MAWTAPSTFVAGAILTAAQLNTNVRDNSLAGGPIYATEALRDAAITAPFEGQRAYITGSTVATATGQGGTAGVPTGIQTIHNGSSTPTYAANWVCVTPVGATSTTQGTTTTSANYVTTLTGDGTAVSVTLTTGASALISIGAVYQTLLANSLNYLSVSVSGASTIAAAAPADVWMMNAVNYWSTLSKTFVLTGLTAGTNVFTLAYKTGPGNTSTIQSRTLSVQGIA